MLLLSTFSCGRLHRVRDVLLTLAFGRYLEAINAHPILHDSTFSPALFKHVPELRSLKVLRLALTKMMEFVVTCRAKDRLLAAFADRIHLAENCVWYVTVLEEVRVWCVLTVVL